MLSTRILVNNEIFNSDPEEYIGSLLGNEIQNVQWEVQDVVFPDGQVVVDIHYDKQLNPTLKTLYVDIKDLKRVNAQNGMFIFEYGESKIPVCLIISPTVLQKYKHIPIKIYEYNKNDKFYSYIARYLQEPLHAYTTILANRFNLKSVWPELVVEDNDERKELYDDKMTVATYTEEISQFDSLRVINKIETVRSFDQTKNAKANIGFVLSFTILPDHDIYGHIIIIAKRRSDLLFYYPNNSNIIYKDELDFIKAFMRFDHTNLPKKSWDKN